MQIARRFFLKQLGWLGFLGLGGGTLLAHAVETTPLESPYLEMDEMYEEWEEDYGLEGWL